MDESSFELGSGGVVSYEIYGIYTPGSRVKLLDGSLVPLLGSDRISEGFFLEMAEYVRQMGRVKGEQSVEAEGNLSVCQMHCSKSVEATIVSGNRNKFSDTPV